MIKISPYGPPSHGLKTEIDGVELKQVRSFDIHCGVGDTSTYTYTAELLAHGPIDWEFPAEVHLHFDVRLGTELVIEERDGKKFVSARQKTATASRLAPPGWPGPAPKDES